MKNKVYPDTDRMRRQSKLACHAINGLAGLGVEVLNVTFRRTNPRIEIAHCPGTRKIRSGVSGQGINNNGFHYITRSSVFCGCQVDWQEIQNV